MNKRSELLGLAESLVNGDRNRQYGDPRSDFLRTADLWEAYLNGAHERHQEEEYTDGEIIVEPHDVAVLMMLLKISRLAWSPDKEDTWADIAGYAACGWDCVAEEEDIPEPIIDEIDLMSDEEIISYVSKIFGLKVDDEEQDDIALEEEEANAALEWLSQLLKPQNPLPKTGGFLGASLFPKGR